MEYTTKVGVEKEGRRTECRNKRDRGSRKGKGELEKEGEGEERGSLESKVAISPLPYAVPYVHTWQCF